MLATQNLKTEFENDFYRIETDFTRSLVRIKWFSALNDAELRAGALRLHTLLQESQLENALSDSQQTTSISAATKDWFASTYYASLAKTNLKRLARVMPSNLFQQIALESIVTRAQATNNLTFQVKNFGAESDAMKWLLG